MPVVAKPARPETVAEYLDGLPGDRRDRFQRLRAAVRAAATDAEEVMAYDMPAYRVGGRFLCSIGAYAKHDSLFPASRVVIDRLGDEVAPYVKGRGTLRFPVRAPLPLDLVGRVVGIRLEELAGARDGRG
jgi:uncharacterized protein YdhG (YjbR/CyaY superfamily)